MTTQTIPCHFCGNETTDELTDAGYPGTIAYRCLDRYACRMRTAAQTEFVTSPTSDAPVRFADIPHHVTGHDVDESVQDSIRRWRESHQSDPGETPPR